MLSWVHHRALLTQMFLTPKRAGSVAKALSRRHVSQRQGNGVAPSNSAAVEILSGAYCTHTSGSAPLEQSAPKAPRIPRLATRRAQRVIALGQEPSGHLLQPNSYLHKDTSDDDAGDGAAYHEPVAIQVSGLLG